MVGLIYVFYNGSNVLQRLNQEVQQIMQESVPTVAPTPLVTVAVLPVHVLSVASRPGKPGQASYGLRDPAGLASAAATRAIASWVENGLVI